MPTLRQYARAIEREWATLIDRPVLLGERDWALICDWHSREIPLAVIEESVSALRETLPRRRTAPRNLGVLAKLVEESWSTVVQGRSMAACAPDSETPTASTRAVDAWIRCAETLPAGDPLREFLERIVERLAGGVDPTEADRELADGLLERLPADLREQLEAAAGAELTPLLRRMTPAVWKNTMIRSATKAARRRLRLPKLNHAAPTQ